MNPLWVNQEFAVLVYQALFQRNRTEKARPNDSCAKWAVGTWGFCGMQQYRLYIVIIVTRKNKIN